MPLSWRDLAIVLACALAARLLFLGLTADTYDYDEFVLLQLARDVAQGAVPYHDFMFFHPPGALEMLRAFDAVTNTWWPAARVSTALLDCFTAAFVWRIAATVYSRRAGVAAGLLYAISPLALISASRVGQDPVIAAIGMLGLMLLVTRDSAFRAALAGVCLGIALWVKYPAAYFLPVYVLAAPRRSPLTLGVAAASLFALMLPFHAEWGALYQQTITFQSERWLMATAQRWQTTALFWLGLNAPAVSALPFTPAPLWMLAGFGLGGVFVLSSQVYYHHFVTVVPFAAMLAGALVARVADTGLGGAWRRDGATRRLPLRLLRALRLPRSSRPQGSPRSPRSALAQRFPRRVRPLQVVLAAIGLTVVVGWGELIEHGGANPLYVTAAHLSAIAPAVRIVERETPAGSIVLADRLEYPYLANRKDLAGYFWNAGVLVDAHYLERRLPAASAVVLSYGASSGYPAGLVAYLDARFPHTGTPAATVWRLAAHGAVVPAGE